MLSAGDLVALAGLIFAAALLYSSVGHAGASGYIAAMALFGLSPVVMKPTALTLNMLVAALACYRLHRADLLRARALVPLLVGSVPMAFVGGAIQLPSQWYKTLLGVVLLLAAGRLFLQPRSGRVAGEGDGIHVPWPSGAMTGAGVGLLSGITGTGGGIFLSPLLLFLGWTKDARHASGITAPFILANSVAGLGGNLVSLASLPTEIPYLVIAALLGALVGTQVGIHWLSTIALQRILAVVLLVAALKLLFV